MENINVGAQYLKENYNKYHDWKIALAAYNEGYGIMDKVLSGKRDLSPITKRYIAGFN